MNKRRAVFLDRDGVLNETVMINGISCPPLDVDALELTPGAEEAVRLLRAAGYLCVCVTNQPDVARGLRTRDNVEQINDRIQKALALDDMFVCYHDNQDNCACRKPRPGMLLAAAEKWDIDLAGSWMVGDRQKDVEAGNTAGCRSILIGPQSQCADVLAAARHIVSTANNAPSP